MRTIEVAPLPHGWRVSVEGLANDMIFHSGGRAEAAARGLATRLADTGLGAELRIRLRDDSPASREVWSPAPAAVAA